MSLWLVMEDDRRDQILSDEECVLVVRASNQLRALQIARQHLREEGSLYLAHFYASARLMVTQLHARGDEEVIMTAKGEYCDCGQD